MAKWADKLDQWFTYSTTKVVIVRDYKLGITYYSALLAIIVYIIYNAIVTGSYLDKSPPIAGSVRATVQLPASLPVPDYCTPGVWNPDGCLFLSADEIIFPFAGEPNSLFVSTRINVANTGPPPAGCDYSNATAAQCRPPSISALPKKTYYVANVESLTIRIDHSIRYQSTLAFGSSGFNTLSSQNMKGSLLKGCSGDSKNILYEMDDAYRKRMRSTYGTSLDVFPLPDLLSAAQCNSTQFSMNIVSDADGSKPGEPLRSSGFIVSLPIYYLNRQDASSLDEIKYRYVPAIIAGSEMKLMQAITNLDGSLTYLDRHGIRVIFAQTGVVGTFNFLALILNLVAALALITLASVVVDLLMIYLMPRRREYQDAKFQETELFSEKAKQARVDLNLAVVSAAPAASSLPANQAYPPSGNLQYPPAVGPSVVSSDGKSNASYTPAPVGYY